MKKEILTEKKMSALKKGDFFRMTGKDKLFVFESKARKLYNYREDDDTSEMYISRIDLTVYKVFFIN